MRLTNICLAYRMYKKPIGFEYRGKNRRIRPITQIQMMNLRKDLEREEQNMLWLRHPYLTIEQAKGHKSENKEDNFNKLKEKWTEEKSRKFAKPVYITDRLKCLMVSDAWE